jgi:hypothetical protein
MAERPAGRGGAGVSRVLGFGERRGRFGQKRREVESAGVEGKERRGFCAEKGRTLGGRRPWKALELPYQRWNALERRAFQYVGREALGRPRLLSGRYEVDVCHGSWFLNSVM